MDWPCDALRACEQTEREFPDWSVTYFDGWGDAARAGYYATRRGSPWYEPGAYGMTPADLRISITRRIERRARRTPRLFSLTP
jgi:hypothetical protein